MRWTYQTKAFLTAYIFLLILAIFANSPDWHYDIAFFVAIIAIGQITFSKWSTTNEATTLFLMVFLPHILGALGLYHLSIGSLSWDMFVHTSTSFFGVLFLYALFRHRHITRIESILALTAIIITLGALVEGIEWAGGRLASPGEGVFFRGAGDFCTKTHPCTEEEDAQKDTVNNFIGLGLGIVAVTHHRRRKRSA